MGDHQRSLLLFLLLLTSTALPDDHKLLLQLKNSLRDPKGALESWNSSSSSMSWRGVTWSKQGQLLGINLDSTGLSGLTSSLQNLTGRLQSLSMAGNNLTGKLEDVLGTSCSLQVLNLAGNTIGGSFPDSILRTCTKLSTLDLSSNALSGDIPPLPPCAGCTAPSQLFLNNNGFTGTFSSNDSGSIAKLHLSHNNLTSVKLSGNWSSLTELDVSYNLMTMGPLLDQEGRFPLLSMLNFSNNKLLGDFAAVLGTPNYALLLPSLVVLDAGFNNMTGGVPSIAAEVRTMKSLDLCSNKFTTVTSDICNRDGSSSLEKLLLVNNQLSDDALQLAMNCTNLTKLALSFNQLNGTIPQDLCKKLPRLRHFMAWANSLHGSIPPTLGADCTNLTTLLLNHNNLEGSIPEELSSSLEWLSLSSNKLTGSIPSSLGLLGKLAFLQLSNNKLDGNISASIANNNNIIWLDLSNNNLTGSIPAFLPGTRAYPEETLSEGTNIGFAKNTVECKGLGGLIELQGVTDERLHELNSCSTARLYKAAAYNYSVTAKNNRSLSSPLSIDVSYNQLTGGIPRELGQLRELIMLDLAHNRLQDSIPSSLGSLRYLSVLDLSSNGLSGLIPDELCNLTFLSSFNVSSNKLSGLIPQKGQFTTFPNDSYAGNAGLCGFPLTNSTSCPNFPKPSGTEAKPQPRGWWKHSLASLVITAFLGSTFLTVLCCWIWWKTHQSQRNRRQQLEKGDGRRFLEQNQHSLSINLALFEKPLLKIMFADLWRATDGFSHEFLIGSGGSGEVYKAQLGDGSVVAAKKLVKSSLQSDREFMAEMETLGKVQHRNLVTLLGYCKCRDEKLLIYEFMEGGSLEQILHDTTLGVVSVPWCLRAHIAMGAARGLAFLHHSCIPHIIHRDMKSSNVLLDSTLREVRVSDFGMARLMCASDTHSSVTTLSGTPGYVPPEYYQSFRCTRNGDVYSFGVILLELLTRKRPTDKEEFGDSNLVGWVKSCMSRGKAFEVLDPEVSSSSRVEMLEYLKIACDCLDDHPHKRPSMVQVVASFKALSLLDHSMPTPASGT